MEKNNRQSKQQRSKMDCLNADISIGLREITPEFDTDQKMPACRGILLSLVLTLSSLVNGQDLHIRWAAAFPGSTSGDLEGKAMARSGSGELYFTNNIGNERRGEAYLNKIDSCGNEVWELRLQPEFEGTVKHTSVAVSVHGDVYLGGYFTGRLDFDPGPSTQIHEAGLRRPAGFVARYSPTGELDWVRVFGDKSSPQYADSSTGAAVFALCFMPTGSLAAAGNFSGTVDFDAGPGTMARTAAGSAGIQNACFFQLAPDGSTIMAAQLSSDSSGSIYSIAADAAGNLYAGGEFRSATDFDPDPVGSFLLSSTGSSDAFVGRYTPEGRLTWARSMGTIFPDLCNSLVADPSGNLYFKIVFALRQNVPMDVDPGPDIFEINSEISSRGIVKFDAQGNFRWAKQYPTNSSNFFYPEYNQSLSLLPTGQLVYVGSFAETLYTDPGNTGLGLNSAGKQDVFLLTHSPEGDLVQAYAFGGKNNEGSSSVLAASSGDVYTSGYFNNEADFDPGPGIYPLNSENRKYHFVQRLAGRETLTYLALQSCRPVTLFNNRYDSSGSYLIRLRSVLGCDSLVSFLLTIGQPSTEIDTLLCAGDSIFAGGRWQRKEGVFNEVFRTADGCDSARLLRIRFRPAPAESLGPDRPLCMGQETILDAGPFRDFRWQDQSTQRTYRVPGTGIFWVRAVDSNGCVYSDTVRFTQLRPPPGRFLPPVKQLCRGEALVLQVPGFQAYRWSTGVASESIVVRNEGMVLLEVTDRYGCAGVDSIRIEKDQNCIPVSIPNAFTPDDNGLNDHFKPLVRQEAEEYLFRVFNQWGQMVFESRQPGQGWDGRFQGRLQSSGTYAYDFYMRNRLGDAFRKKGTVALIR